MMQTERYTAEFVTSFPTPMEPGVLYVSTAYSTAGHICPCGCGREVVTKLSPARWRAIYDGEISLRPSVASTGLPCNSHYFITRGKIDWYLKLDSTEKAEARSIDQRARDLSREPTLPRSEPRWQHLKRRLARIRSRGDA